MTEPRVRVAEVAYPPIRPDQLVDRGLDRPRPGGADSENSSDVHALKIRGWAIAKERPITRFELVSHGTLVDSTPALPGPDGELARRIELDVSSLDLPYTFRVSVRAVLDGGTRAPVARLAGTRAALPGAPVPGPCPVLISTIGRCGSTALLNLLCHHPDLAGYRTWDSEPRVVSYWTSVLRGLARPASYERQLAPWGSVSGMWWVGQRPPDLALPAAAPPPPALGREGVEAVAAFCRSQIGLIGTALAAEAGKPGARYLVEKAAHHAVRSVAEVTEELDPRSREIVLVRDFRDVACSMVSYARDTKVRGFGPHDNASVRDTIRWLSTRSVPELAAYAQRRREQAHVVRYEDLIAEPEATLTAALEYVGVDAAPPTVTRMLTRLGAEADRRAAHATTGSTQDSVGRWRRELDAADQAVAEELLRPQLDAFGYA